MSPRPKQANSNQEQCPTPQNSPTHTPKSSVTATAPAKPHRNEIQGILPDKRRVHCLRRQPPRVAFRNNDIYIIDDKEYKEPRKDTLKSSINYEYVTTQQLRICPMKRTLMTIIMNL